MQSHIKVLGVLHIVFGALGIVAGLIAMLVLGGIASFVGVADRSADSWLAVPILGGIGIFVFVLLLALSLPGVIIGFGLTSQKSWARIAGIVLSALELIHVPFGTILGAYGLWVLLNAETERIFRQAPTG